MAEINLKHLRMEKHLSQVELARAVGVSKQYIYQIESGKTTPSIKIAKKIGKILDIEWYKLV